MGLADRSLPTKAYARSVNNARPDANGNIAVSIGDLADVSGTPSDGDTFIYNSTTNVFEVGHTPSKVDNFSITGTGTSVFTLTHTPVADSWNVELNGVRVHSSEFSVSSDMLTITTPTDLFKAAATQGSPWDLEVQYDYSAAPPTPVPDTWAISGNKALTVTPPVIVYLDMGTTITSVSATIGGDLTGVHVGIYASSGNYFAAQYEQVGTNQIRILCTRNGFDENLGSGLTDAPMTLFAGDVLGLTVNWGTRAVTLTVNGATQLSGTLSVAQATAYGSATSAMLRSGAPSTFDDLRVNGSVVDDFNRADAPDLGTASGGGVWQAGS